MHLILKHTFFETHKVDLKHKTMHLCCVMIAKKLTLKLTILLIGGTKLNLVSMDQMENDQIAVVVQLEQLQGNHGEV